MKRRPSVSRRVVALLVVLGVAFSLAPRQLFAAEGSPSPGSPGPLAASISKAARTVPLATPAAPARVAKEEQPKGGSELAGSSSFFTQPLGIAVLAVLAVGTGYAVYSTAHDRIHSEIRKNQ